MTNGDSLSLHQKLSLGVFIVIGLATAVLGYLRVTKAIELPFRRTGSLSLKTAEQIERERLDELRQKDTDADGLNDYDEFYVFKTSAFLEDTDSDGLKDGDEVATESDPNCPKGQTCRQAKIFSGSGTAPAPSGSQPATGGTASASAEQEARITAVITETFGDPSTLTPEKIVEELEKMSPADLRSFFAKLGVPEDALRQADDATLRQLLKETLDEVSAQQ